MRDIDIEFKNLNFFVLKKFSTKSNDDHIINLYTVDNYLLDIIKLYENFYV